MAYTENKKPDGLDTQSSLADGDLIVHGDISDSGRAKGITWLNVKSAITSLVEGLSSYFDVSSDTSDAITQGTTNLFLTSAERTKLTNTPTDTTTELAGKADTSHTHTHADITDYDTELAGKTNTTAFTPTADYHVATKKYVDDNAGGGAVDSVNSQTGAVVLDADDIDDTSTTNKFATAAQLSKLDGVEANATADQTGAEIKAAYEAEADTNAFTDAEKTKLGTVETNADATDTANVTAAGALMDSEVSDLAGVKSLDTSTLPNISSGAGTPSSTPSKVGDIYIDTTNDNAYIAVGTASSSDWEISNDGAGGGISDGDKGDITVSGSGTTWTIDDEAVSLTKMAHVATNRILGRSTAGTGDVEALTANDAADTIGVGTSDSPQFAGVNVGHATDTTITRVSAGVIAVEGTNVQLEPSEGGFADGDKTKLDGIEASADVTDTANVTAAGALMDSELTDETFVKAVSDADTSTVNTGTSTTAAVTPDALAGSYAGTKSAQMVCFEWSTDVATGDGAYYFRVPSALNGMNIIDVHAEVVTAGTTGTTDIQLHNVTDSVDILSTKLTIDSGETGSDTAATAAVINTSNDDLATNDIIRVDVDAVSTTAPQGLIVTFECRLP